MAPKKSQETTNKKLHNSKQRKGADILDHEFPTPDFYQQCATPPAPTIHLRSIFSNKTQSTEKAPQSAEDERDQNAQRKEHLARPTDLCERQMDESQPKKMRTPNILRTSLIDSRKRSISRKPLKYSPPVSMPLSWRQFIDHPSQLSSHSRHFPPIYRTSPTSPRLLRSPTMDKISTFRSAWTPIETDEDENEDKDALQMPTEIEETLRKLDNFIKQIKTQRSCPGPHFLIQDELNIQRTDEEPSREQVAPHWVSRETSCPKRYFQDQGRFHPTRLAVVHTTPLVGKRPRKIGVTPKTSTTRNQSGFVLAPASAKKKKRIPRSVWED